jgi:hypothetical protein
MRKSMCALGAIVAMAAVPAMAQADRPRTPMDEGRGPGGGGPGGGGQRPDPAKIFAMMDANRDGSVSKAEFDAFHSRMGRRGEHGRTQGQPPMREPGGAQR